MLNVTGDVSQKILSATFELLSMHGYANVSMRDIAKKSGIAVSQITYYYKTKENLLVEVIKEANREYLSELDQKLEGICLPNEKMKFIFDWLEKLITEKTALYRLLLDFYSLATWNEEIRKEFKSYFNETVSLLCKNLNHVLLKNTHLGSYSHRQIAKLIAGAGFGVAMQYVMDENNTEAVSSLKIIRDFFS
ncbi:MAG: TetR/AcrR family transcriptional regulator [Alphaproteobacteria bacterium]|nr:TetR/AcrR family transcriptional regulator [Alphaproteobacteria bacterium]